MLHFCPFANGQITDSIEIHGEIKNFKEQVVQVTFRWQADGKYYKDSCVVNNSIYVYTAKISEPTLFSLQPLYKTISGEFFYKLVDERRESYGFFLDPKNVKLTSIGSFSNTICSDSKSNKVYEAYRKENLKSRVEIEYEAYKIFNTNYLFASDSSKVLAEIVDSLNFNEDKAHFKKFAISEIGPYLLNNMYNQRYNVDTLKELYNLLSDTCKRTASAKLLLAKLNGYAPLSIGQNFDWFTMCDTSGKSMNLNLRSKLILVDLWASWCAPCRAQMKQLKNIYSTYHEKGFEVVAVSLDEKPALWKKAIIQDDLPWINLSDLKGWNNKLIVKFYIGYIPYNILINDKGRIIATEISIDELAIKCEELLGAP